MEHTACGTVSGAIDNAEMGNRKGSNHGFVDAVAKTNAEMTIEDIRENSQVLKNWKKLEKSRLSAACTTWLAAK